jgi:GNAT superfamily N-acetyltransferase
MHGVEFAPLERQHGSQVLALLRGTLLVPLPRLHQRLEEAYERDARLGLAQVALCRPAGNAEKVVGVLLARVATRRTCCAQVYIDAVAVDAVFQGQGIGSRLLLRVLTPCLPDGLEVREVFLHTPLQATELVAFYRSCGFESDDEVIDNYYPRRWMPQAQALVLRWRPPTAAQHQHEERKGPQDADVS